MRIKEAVFNATGLSCSIGITQNKLLSKICSELDKPDGITILDPSEFTTRIWPLAAKKINGIGPKANQKLQALNIHTIGELAAAPSELLIAHFGRSTGNWMTRVAQGIDERPVVTWSEPKSLSRETTFERDLHARHDRAKLSEIFTNLCSRLADDLQRKGYTSRTIGIKLKFADFQVITRDLTLPDDVMDGRQIRLAATECLKRVPLEQKIRLLGVRAAGLRPVRAKQSTEQATQPNLPLEFE
jgi:DNA polymerase-4